MSEASIKSNLTWDVNKYKNNYDKEHWALCKTFMDTHKTKFTEQKLVHLTEAFYQMGVYGSSYDPKTTRMVNALAIEVLDDYLKSYPGTLFHPFDPSAVVVAPPSDAADESLSTTVVKEPTQSSSIWDVAVDQSIIVNVLNEDQMKELFKGFVLIYDIRGNSTMNDNKVTILEESFKRSKFGPCHWAKDDTHNNICPIRTALKWRHVVLAEAVGGDENSLKIRVAQAVLSKMSNFCSGVEAKWSYYRDGMLPDRFDSPNPRKSHIYRLLRRSQFKSMAEIISYVDTFANSDSFAEIIFSMDFSNQEKKQLMEYIEKSWGTKLTYRTLSKTGVKNKSESYVFVYHIRSGEELRHWLEQTDGENDRYRHIAPGNHRRAGKCDSNVREVDATNTAEKPNMEDKLDKNKPDTAETNKQPDTRQEIIMQKGVLVKNTESADSKEKDKVSNRVTNNVSDKNRAIEKKSANVNENNSKKVSSEKTVNENPVDGSEDLEKLLDGFVLFYDASKTSEIDKDDWFTALVDSFKLSKFGPLEVTCENVTPLRMRCVFKWKDMTLASAEGLTETQAKTAATLQLISKLEPFTYILQAKEEYFQGGKVPEFLEESSGSKDDFVRLVRRKDLPSYYSIFQTIDEFSRSHSKGEIIFGPDFTWELKNEISVYLKAKNLSHRYFTSNDQKPWTHMAVYHTINPEELKDHLVLNGGENPKYKLIPPSKAEPIKEKTSEGKVTKDVGKSTILSAAKKPIGKEVEKRKEREPSKTAEPEEIDLDSNKIQIKLKKFKVDKIDYPEDTGGIFPGLIIWVGIRKNSTWQRNVVNILLESFKMSKFGELIVEETEENVWNKKEPIKKCVIKASRKVLAVGLGDKKMEAKNSAALQVMRMLRKHCYTIQAKESYFKEGKATPYNFNPDPAKSHIYKLVKRSTFKDRSAMLAYVNNFAKNNGSEEVIFGDDFTYDEREHILDHCRKIELNYRLMKCQSIKTMHTHIAIYHQQPLPLIKAELIKEGGENDMYRLINPGEKITNQNNDVDLWPETLENRALVSAGKETTISNQPIGQKSVLNQNIGSNPTESGTKPSLSNRVATLINKDAPVNSANKKPDEKKVQPDKSAHKSNDQNKNLIAISTNTTKVAASVQSKAKPQPTVGGHSQAQKSQPVGQKSFSTQNRPAGPNPPHPMVESQPLYCQPFGPQPFFVPYQEIPFGPQPHFIPPPPVYNQPFMDTPLQFGPNPPAFVPQQPMEIMPVGMGVMMPTVFSQQELTNQPPMDSYQSQDTNLPPSGQNQISVQSVTVTVPNSPKKSDLREELSKKRLGENRKRGNKEEEDSDGWSRKVFVAEESKNENRRREVGQAEAGPSKTNQDFRKNSGRNDAGPSKTNQDFRRNSGRNDESRLSPKGNFKIRKRTSSFEVGGRDCSNERWRDKNAAQEERIVRRREGSYERRVYHDESGEIRDRSRSNSPRKEKDPYEMVHENDLWHKLPVSICDSTFMYKYVKQDSRTETDPYALLRATRSLSFNVDFDIIKEQTAIDEWYVTVELTMDHNKYRPLVGEALGRTQKEASLRAVNYAVDTIQRACRVIEPNFRYFHEGGEPDFIIEKHPVKTAVYEIIHNMDPDTPLSRYTIEMMFNMFISSDLEDLFFLAGDFSHKERVLVVDIATEMDLWWRLFGPRRSDARSDDIVNSQHVCVSKPKTTLQLAKELMGSGGYSEKYTLVDNREPRPARSRTSNRGQGNSQHHGRR